jgi:hypothetical protein
LKRSGGIACGLVFLCASAAFAAPRDPSLLSGETGFPAGDFLGYQFTGAPGRDGFPSITEQQEEGQFVVAKSSADILSVSEKAGRFHLTSPVTIAQTGLVVPENLWSVEAGGAYGRRLSQSRTFGVNMGIGSKSDRLFDSIHETTLRASANYRLPTDPGRAWLFFLTYSNNRNFLNNIPIPGVAYSIDSPKHHLKAILGLPFISLIYRPAPDLTESLAILGPRHLTAEIGYGVKVQTYGRFELGSQEWLLANRENNRDQLFFDRKRLLAGVRLPLPHGLRLDASTGREYDRRFFENTSSSHRHVPAVELPSAWLLDAKIVWRFKTVKQDDIANKRLGTF